MRKRARGLVSQPAKLPTLQGFPASFDGFAPVKPLLVLAYGSRDRQAPWSQDMRIPLELSALRKEEQGLEKRVLEARSADVCEPLTPRSHEARLACQIMGVSPGLGDVISRGPLTTGEEDEQFVTSRKVA